MGLCHIFPPAHNPLKMWKTPARAGQEPRSSQPLIYTAGQQNGKLSVTPLGWIWKGSEEEVAVFWGPEWAGSWLDREVAGEQDGLTERSRVTVRPASQSLLSCYLCGFDQVAPCASSNWSYRREKWTEKPLTVRKKMRSFWGALETDKHPTRPWYN